MFVRYFCVFFWERCEFYVVYVWVICFSNNIQYSGSYYVILVWYLAFLVFLFVFIMFVNI